MKLRPEVIKKLDCNKGYATIMLALDCSHSSARDYVKKNSDELTKAACLIAIANFTGTAQDRLLINDAK